LVSTCWNTGITGYGGICQKILAKIGALTIVDETISQ
jgi:hypothetical protein